MNKVIVESLFIALITIIFTCQSALASETPKVFLEDQEISFDIPPIIENGRTLVPLRTIFEALGATLEWDDKEKIVTATKDNTEIKLVIGGISYKNGVPVSLDIPTRIINGTAVVPLRFAAESLGYYLFWDEASQTVTIANRIYPEKQPPQTAITLPSGYVQYGPYDYQGIPLRDFKRSLGVVYHPLVVAEYGSYYNYLYKQTKDLRYLNGLKKMAEWLVINQDQLGFWNYNWDSSYGGVNSFAPWQSAVMQGFGAQTLVKAAAATGNSSYLDSAERALTSLGIPVEQGGVSFSLKRGKFYEEVPKETATHILNGHLTAITGIYKMSQIRNSDTLNRLFREGIYGLDFMIDCYDTGYWSRYDMLMPSEDNTQYIVIASKYDFKQDIKNIHYKSDFAILEYINEIDISSYKSFEGLLDKSLSYYLFRVIPKKKVLAYNEMPLIIYGEYMSVYLTWKENKGYLVRINNTQNITNHKEWSIKPGLFGNPVGLSYHEMMIKQLEYLSGITKNNKYLEVAERWEKYHVLYGDFIKK